MTDRLQRMTSLSVDQLRLLAARLQEKEHAGAPPIVRRSRPEGPLPLSFAQERLWFLDRMEPGTAVYNLPTPLRLSGPLDAEALRRTLEEVVRRHEALRTTFAVSGDQPFQVIATPTGFPLPQVDLAALPAAVREEELARLLAAEARRPFDLEKGPLLRAALLRLSAVDHALALTAHHIVSDGWSADVLMREMDLLYGAFAAGRPSPLPELPVQYADWALWQREHLQDEILAAHLAFWRERLDGVPLLKLPADRLRPPVQTFRGAEERVVLPAELVNGLETLARREGATLFMALLAAFQGILCRLSAQTDFAVGSPIANRGRREIEGLIGFFANILALRADLSGDLTFRELLGRVRAITLEAFAHEELPFEKLVAELQPERDRSRPPLVQVFCSLQSRPALRLGGLGIEVLDAGTGTARVDLTLIWHQEEGVLRGTLEHNTDLFGHATARRLLEHQAALLRAALADPERQVWELPLLAEAERRQVLGEWSSAGWEFPAPILIHELFAEQAARTPDKLAAACKSECLAYRELDERAGRLAGRIASFEGQGLVGLMTAPDLPLLVGMLGILRAGSGFVPLDPDLPDERLERMIADCGLTVVAADGRNLDRAADIARRCPAVEHLVCLDDEWEPPPPVAGGAGNGTAYVIFTSGSTGVPKGVPITHENLVPLLLWSREAFGFGEHTRVLQSLSYAFDFGIFEILTTLLFGGTLVMRSGAERSDIEGYLREIRKHAINTLHTTPSFFRAVAAAAGMEGLPTVQVLHLGGEALGEALVEEAFALVGEECRVFNGYGPTEAAVNCALFEIGRVADWRPRGLSSIPIGHPSAANRLYVLDPRMQLVPVGVPGELLVGGVALSRGYLGQPDLTAARFIPDPFGEPGERLYRTGDLVRFHADRAIEFLGRVDNQVKVRGYRIELEEIEAALATHPEVGGCAVAAARQEGGEARLVAYVAARQEKPPDIAELRRFLGRTLPAYMAPAAFVFLPELPLNVSGKVDRNALPAPDWTGRNAWVAPRTPLEELLAGLWEELLGRERVGTRDNFFELGGHSLLATRMLARVRAAIGVDLPVRRLFEVPTVEELAAAIESAGGGTPLPALVRQPRRPGEAPPLSFAQERLWFLDRIDPGAPTYNIPGAVELAGRLDVAALVAALRAVVGRHEVLRTVFRVVDSEPHQQILPALEIGLPMVDLAGLPPAGRLAEAKRLAEEHTRHRFDLARGPLLDAALLRVEAERHHLLVVLHHAICDGWSLTLLVREIGVLYAAFWAGQPSPLIELPIQYADFAIWQRNVVEASRQTELAWWEDRLGGEIAPLDLPTDRTRPPVQTYRGGQSMRLLPPGLTGRLAAFGRSQGATLFMTLLAAIQALLHRQSGQDDILVGAPVAGRRAVETEELIGCFLNTLVLRTDLGGRPGFRELVARVRQVTLGAYSHQDVPFEAVLASLPQQRDLSRTPLFQVMVNLLNLPAREMRLPGLEMQELALSAPLSKLDMTFYLSEGEGGVRIELVYNADLFDAARMEDLLDQLALFLEQALERSEEAVGALSLVTVAARAVLPDPAAELSAAWESAVHEVFARHARRAPGALAAADPAESWTYGELDERSDRLAWYLGAAGVGRGDVVAFWAHRSAPLVWGVLGTLKAGAAFLMLDPRHPAPRQGQMLTIAKPAAWLQLATAGPVPAEIARALDVVGCARRLTLPARADDPDFLAGFPAVPPAAEVGPSDTAYVAFTSGSTGLPKGVLGRHGSLSHFIPWLRSRFELSAADRFSMLSGLAHDPLHRDIFTPLQIGAAVVIPHPETMDEPGGLATWMRREAVTIAHLTPALGQVLTAEAPNPSRVEVPSLRYAFLVGDVLTRRDVARLRRLAPAVTCVNYYGSTETQRAVGYHIAKAGPEDGGAVRIKEILPLGRGIPDVQLLILNPAGALAGIGELGEVSVRSPHIALGYLGDPQLTSQRFMVNPFSEREDDRLYRTGDLGRYLPDGEAVFVGRADTQVKIRGFRIELGEIESVLGSFSGVREAVVIARQDRGEERYLAAYLVPIAGATLDERELRAFLCERLPDSMVPATFTLLDQLPLTPNRKVDRKALPAPEASAVADAFVAPRNPVEEVLAGIWAEVLGVERVGIEDDFFVLGGHSLLATRVIARTWSTFGVEIPLRVLFEERTIAGLARRVEGVRRAGRTAQEPLLAPIPRERDLPLSFAQERFWFLDQLQPGSAAYNIPTALRLEGSLDVAALASALTEVVRRHETLRTTFPVIEGAPVQRISPPDPFPLAVVDLAGLPEDAREIEGACLVADEARRPFDLAGGPLLRAILIRLGGRDHLQVINQHHIVSDGWSMGIFVRELRALYGAFAAGAPSPLPELPIQYADFADWQRRWLSGTVLTDLVAWWKERLTPEPPVLELPTDRPRSVVETFRGARQALLIPPELTAALTALGRQRGSTLFMILLAAFDILLCRYSGQEDLAVGSPIAGRARVETEGLIGLFINTLVLRADLAGDPSFTEALARVRDAALGAYAHQELPFEKLVEELRLERSLGRSPLFQALFVLQTTPAEEPAVAAGLAMRPLHTYHGVARFDLTVSLTEIDQRIVGYLEYKTNLLDAATTARWAGHLTHLLSAAAAAPERRISELPMLSAAELAQLLTGWSDIGTPGAAAPETCVHHLVAAQAARTPEAVAVTFEGGTWTYRELEARANRLARRLRALGVGPETLVGIALERCPELLAATLAVWKAGGAYVPLDPAYPAERLAFMLRDSRIGALVSHSGLATSLPEHGVHYLFVDLPGESGGYRPEDGGAEPDNLAYVIYTSGSTGTPKGVQIPHRALINFLLSMLREPGLSADDTLLAITSLSFDIAALELFLPLLAGARLEIVPSETVRDGRRLLERVRASGATVMQATPSTWRLLLEAGWEEPVPLRILSGGEALLGDLAASLRRRGSELWNLYGPTETTVWSAVHRVHPDHTGAVPLGRPVANTQIYVLDHKMQPAPLGMIGEVWIGGGGLARGYLGRPELTAERFAPDPFAILAGARIYRTGDLARPLADGRLDFLGRADQQVKIRGHRIELGEIEAALCLHPAVAQAAVATRENRGDSRLVAYVVPAAGREICTAELRTWLRQRLPEPMQPSAWVMLPSLPLTPNRKVDRKALPAPEAAASGFAAPRDLIEELLTGLFAEVLETGRVGIDDDFFALGGHSLLATRIAARAGRVLGVTPPVRWIFERPTVRGLSARIAEELRAGRRLEAPPITRAPRKGELPLSFAQQRLWFLDRLERSGAYNMPALLRLEGKLEPAALAAALAGVVRRHEALRTTFPDVEGEPRQVIAPADNPVSLPIVDLGTLPAARQGAEIALQAVAEATRPLDLQAGPLLRAILFRLTERRHGLLLVAHHIVCDAWSVGIFVREISAFYAAVVQGGSPRLPELPVQYADFAAWQRRWLTPATVARLAGSWHSRLAGAPAALDLPTDRPHPPVQTFRGDSIPLRLDDRTAAPLLALARREGASLFMVLLAAFQTLLHRLSGQDDLVVGSPVASRTRPELEDLIGLFLNTLPLRGDLSGDPSFRELLARVRETALDAFALQDLPFEKLVEELEPPRDLARPPLFQVMLILQNAPVGHLDLPGLSLTLEPLSTGTAKLELLLSLGETEDGLAGALEYNSDLFDRATAERLVQGFSALLAAAAADSGRRLTELPLLALPEGVKREAGSLRISEEAATTARRVPPRGSIEEAMAALWSEVLATGPMGAEDNFFELGGHSILATRLLYRVQQRFGVDLPLRALFEAPTVADLSAAVTTRRVPGEQPAAILPEIVPDPASMHLPFPLTDVQEAYWVGRSGALELGSVSTHIYFEVDLRGLDLGRLEAALRHLIDRHGMLRAVVLADGRQRILPEVPSYRIGVVDLRVADAIAADEALAALRDRMSHQVLPSDRWPLFEISAARLRDGRTRLHVSLDLLIGDAWSFRILGRELALLYSDPGTELPPLTLSFRDCVLAEAALQETEVYRRAFDYWRGRLATLPPAPALPLAKSPSSLAVPRFVRRRGRLERDAWSRLKTHATQVGLTPSSLLATAYAQVLTAWSRSPRLTLNLTLFNRPPLHPEMDRIVGDFTSLTLLACEPLPGEPFEERARRLQGRLWEDLEHRPVSGVRVVRELARAQGGPGPLMPIVFTSTLNATGEEDGAAEAESPFNGEMVYSITQTPQVWLDHQVAEATGTLTWSWDAVEELFPPGLLDGMFEAYGRLLERLAQGEDAWREPVRDLLPAEHLRLIAEANATEAPGPAGLLHELFLGQARRRPDAPALITSHRTISYGELDRASLALARRLRHLRARPDTLVAVVMEKGWEQVLAVLAILRAGAAYLPIDARLPRERIHYLLERGEVDIALTRSGVGFDAPPSVEPIAVCAEMLATPRGEPLPPIQRPGDLAYVIFTSGSTGQPKGVMIDHRGVLNTVVDVNQRLGIGSADRVLALSSLSFDLSVWDIFGLLAAGGAIVVPDAGMERNPAHWVELAARFGVTIWNTVPALMEMLVEYGEGRPDVPMLPLRAVLLSGDWIPLRLPGRIRAAFPNARVISLGGATEASIWSILYPVGTVAPDWGSIPYGKAMANQRFFVLDEEMEPRPVWVQGDLYIGGIGLARGYWRDEEKTRAAFLVHPRTGERLYRTGDLGRLLPDGDIEFLGRDDFQVKVQGHRIELGEIEAALSRHPTVAGAVVSSVGERLGAKQLVAWVVLREPSLAAVAPASAPVLLDPVERLRFKLQHRALRRDLERLGRPAVSLKRPELTPEELEARFLRRRSFRRFQREPIPLDDLAGFLSCLLQVEVEGSPFPKHRYGSAGNLYPIQTYLWAKPGRVEGLEEGFYYYDPREHRLFRLAGDGLDASLYDPANRETFEEAAFALFLIARMAAITPLYGKSGWRFAVLEAGLVTQLLEMSAPDHRLGLSQMGGVRFEPIRDLFALDDGDELVHTILGGRIAAGQTGLAAFQVEAARDRDLVRLLEPEGGAPPDLRPEREIFAELREHLRSKLPDYMMPTHFVRLEEIPLSANGKVDRKALPQPEALRQEERPASPVYVAPETELERAIAGVVSNVLGLSRIGVHDNFFDLGATSVHVVRAHNALRLVLGREVSLVEMFNHPSVSRLALHLAEEAWPAVPRPDPERSDAVREGQDWRRQRLQRAQRARG